MPSAMRLDLKPCPFCGSPAQYSDFDSGWDGKRLCDLGCSNSFCLPSAYICEVPPEEAIPAWQNRKQDELIEEYIRQIAVLKRRVEQFKSIYDTLSKKLEKAHTELRGTK